MDELQLFYDLLTINIVAFSSARWIEKLNRLHEARGP